MISIFYTKINLNRIRARIRMLKQYTQHNALFDAPTNIDYALVTAISFLRLLIVLAIAILISFQNDYYKNVFNINSLRWWLIVSFIYNIAIFFIRVSAENVFQSKRSLTIQVYFDVFLYGWLYWLSSDVSTAVFFLLWLPLFLAGEYFDLKEMMRAIFTAFIVFFTIMWVNNHTKSFLNTLMIFLPRFGMLVILTSLAFFRSRLRPIYGEISKLFWNKQNRYGVFERNPAIYQTIQSALNLPRHEALSQVIEMIANILDCKVGVIRLLSKNHTGYPELQLAAYSGIDNELAPTYEWLPLDKFSSWLANFFLSDDQHYRQIFDIQGNGYAIFHFKALAQKYNLHTAIAAKLESQSGKGNKLGVIAFYRDSIRGFLPEEIKFVQQIAELLTLVISYYEYLERISKDAKERDATLAMLQKLSRNLVGIFDQPQLLRIIVEEMMSHLNIEMASVFIPQDQYLIMKAQAGLSDIVQDWEQYKIGEGITGKCYSHATAYVENDIDQSFDVLPQHREKYKLLTQNGAKHLLAVPMIGRNGTIGVLRVINRLDDQKRLLPTGFSSEDQRTIELMCALFVPAYEATGSAQSAKNEAQSLRLLNENRRLEITRTNALATITQALNSTRDLTAVLQIFCDQMRNIFNVDAVGIVLFDELRNYGQLISRSPSLMEGDKKYIKLVLRENKVVEELITRKRPVYIYDALNDPRLEVAIDMVRFWKIKSYLFFPLIVRDQVIGSIGLDSIKSFRQYTQDEIDLGIRVVAQASLAIANSQLYAELQVQSDRLREYLQAMGSRLAKSTDLRGLYTYIVHSGAEFLFAEDCSLFIIENDTQTEIKNLKMVAASRLPGNLIGRKEMPVVIGNKVGLTVHVAATGESLRFIGDEYKKHYAWSGEFTDHLSYLQSNICHSLLMVPIMSMDGGILGVLKVENKMGKETEKGFTSFDRELLEILARQVATDITQLKQLEQSKQDAANNERDRITGNLHDLLNTLKGGVVLESDYAESLLSNKCLDKLPDSLAHIKMTANSVYDELYATLEDLRDPILEIQGLIPAIERYCNLLVKRKNFEIKKNINQRLNLTEENLLYQIAKGAISNSVKHAKIDKLPDGMLKINLFTEDKKIKLEIYDNGCGFIYDHVRLPYGLNRMQKLATDLNAEFNIETFLSKGTKIQVAYYEKEAYK